MHAHTHRTIFLGGRGLKNPFVQLCIINLVNHKAPNDEVK